MLTKFSAEKTTSRSTYVTQRHSMGATQNKNNIFHKDIYFSIFPFPGTLTYTQLALVTGARLTKKGTS